MLPCLLGGALLLVTAACSDTEQGYHPDDASKLTLDIVTASMPANPGESRINSVNGSDTVRVTTNGIWKVSLGTPPKMNRGGSCRSPSTARKETTTS